MTAKLSVNVNKIATLRNARGKDRPNVLEQSLKIVACGAQGITVHPRPDGRHIRWSDVYELKQHLSVELNIEGYPSEDFLHKVGEIRPEQCTLVPDPPDVLTSNAGWRVFANEDFLRGVIPRLKNAGTRLSLFIDPQVIQLKELLLLRDLGVDRVELYTEDYAENFKKGDRRNAVEPYQQCAQLCHSMGLGVNAGHDLNLENLAFFAQSIPELLEVSIGHALVCDALEMGWQATVQAYLNCLRASSQ